MCLKHTTQSESHFLEFIHLNNDKNTLALRNCRVRVFSKLRKDYFLTESAKALPNAAFEA